jgi:membrane protease YdiL (CAAX protease family)
MDSPNNLMNNIPEAIEPTILDIQHDTDPAHDHGPAKRIPHLGHAALFFSVATMWLALSLTLFWSTAHIHTDEAARTRPGIALAAQALAYLFTLISAWWLFPKLWEKSFLHGIQWNVLAAHRRWYWIVPGAVLLSAVAQGATHFIHTPDKIPIDDLMTTAHGAWLTAAFGVLLAPLTEEIAFRGFLLPALATAYDWLALDRTPAGLRKWENGSMHSTSAVVFGAVVSSLPFALLHYQGWGVVAILYGVSLVLSFVRVKTNSVACSTLLHATYNLTIFTVIFIYTSGFRHLERLHP